jgi:hypothetical protein
MKTEILFGSKIGGLPMTCSVKKNSRDYSKIGYHGRPITELSREELLAAFAELAELFKESQRKNKKCREVLGADKFESL